MPVYEFRCRDCKKEFEIVVPISGYDPDKVACPQCGGRSVERLWSRVFAVTSKKS